MTWYHHETVLSCPGNTWCEAGIHHGWDASPSQDTKHTHSDTHSHQALANSPFGIFLGGNQRIQIQTLGEHAKLQTDSNLSIQGCRPPESTTQWVFFLLKSLSVSVVLNYWWIIYYSEIINWCWHAPWHAPLEWFVNKMESNCFNFFRLF